VDEIVKNNPEILNEKKDLVVNIDLM